MQRLWYALFIAAVTFVTSVSVAQATNWEVPGDDIQIKDIILNSASSGDTITVVEATINTEQQAPFSVSYPVTILNLTGETITIEGTTSYAVSIGPGLLDGFRIVGGTGLAAVYAAGAEIRNCTIEDDGNDYLDGVVILDGSSKLVSSTVTLTSTDSPRAIYLEGPAAQLNDCTITTSYVTGSGGDAVIESFGAGNLISGNTITVSDSTSDAVAINVSASGAVVIGNYIQATFDGILATTAIESITDNFVRVRGVGVGISVSGSGSLAIERNTIYSGPCDQAVGVFFSSGSATLSIENNLFVNMDYGIFSNSGTSSSTINHNIYWGSCAAGSNLSLTSTQMANKEPLFCKEREAPVAFFTQRIDSEASRGNNGWDEQVGAFDVECAWGSLARNTTIADGSTVTVLEDVTVPSDKSLTIEEGSVLLFDEDDGSPGSGSNSSKNELIVDGSITVSGTSGSRVVFKSAKATPAEGDWYVLDCFDATSQSITYADIQHTEYGVRMRRNAASSLTNSLLSNNSSIDILVTSTGSDSTSATITGNTITVGWGTGIDVSGNASGTTIENNTLTGSSTSYGGIQHVSLNGASKPSLINNTVSGFTNAKAIESNTGAPVLKKNKVQNGKWGIYVSGGNPTIGVAADTTSDNIASGNSNSGLFMIGSSTTGKVRQSRFTGNGSGVVTKGNANPDLGTSGDYGNNIFVDNTTYCLWNQSTSGTVSTQGNYKGDCSSPSVCWNGSFDLLNALCTLPSGVELPVEAVAGQGLGSLLRVPHPNPSAGPTVIGFRLATAGAEVTVAIYDVGGRLVRRFTERPYDSGDHEVFWDGRSDSGRPSSNGLYFVRVLADGSTVGTTRLILAR